MKSLFTILIFISITLEVNARTILVLGDSNGAAENGWVKQLHALCPADTLINCSISGNTIGFDNLGNTRLNTLKMLETYMNWVQTAPDAVYVLLGSNDCKAEFAGREREVSANYALLLDRLRARFPQARLVTITPPPMGYYSKMEAKYKGGQQRVEQLVVEIKQISAARQVTCIDIHTPMKADYGKLTTDGVHLTTEGYQWMAKLIHRQLLPLLFVIGDSISLQYGPWLEQFVSSAFRYDRKRDDGGKRAEDDLDTPQGANGGDSRMVLEYLRRLKAAHRLQADYLLINCGLHDIKTEVSSGKIQISQEEYRCNLDSIFQEVNGTGVKLVWVRSTPVNEELHNTKGLAFNRYSADVEKYNRIADNYFLAKGIPIIDLYHFSKSFPKEATADHVHYTEEYSRLQAAFIAGFLLGTK